LLDGLERLNLDMEPDYDDGPTPTGAYPIIKDPEAEATKLRDIIRSSDIEKLNELIMIDRRSNTVVSHRDVGIGVSQILPVLVSAYASQNQIVAIEQPEIHLHPAIQADLGDVFLQSALGENRNRFLIETHSEHLLLRVMRRMRETSEGTLPNGVPKVIPSDVALLYVEIDGPRSIVREMPLNDKGELVKAWPGGFFEEGLREVFS
jgi:predicted ATPase